MCIKCHVSFIIIDMQKIENKYEKFQNFALRFHKEQCKFAEYYFKTKNVCRILYKNYLNNDRQIMYIYSFVFDL